jgi:2-dehydropantoate 2-reductase
MRVAVVGAGGIGGLYGGLLSRGGHDVSFLARGEHLRGIQSRGLEVRSAEFGTFTVDARASDNPSDLGEADLVLFAVKTYDLDQAAQAASQLLAPAGSLLTLQNGLDAPDRVGKVLGQERVLIGTTFVETTILEPGVIGHLSTFHAVFVGSLVGPPSPRVERVVGTLTAAGIKASVAQDGRRALWEKALGLIPLATITSVCRATVGPIRDLPETRRLLEDLLDEVMAVAHAAGYDLADARMRTLGVYESWAYDGKASMARDFERGNHTELEALTGALVRLADASGVEVPVSRTAYAILKLREQLGAKQR